ncbi:MAG: ABC transporter substrate-binding protein [Dehalococcoidia bacterium]|nr:ABC transporter substrate-binding protein [Dehalococcoidia bacterium]
MGKKVWLLLLIGVFLTSMLIAGCGGSSSETEPIKVGVPEKITGPYASDALVSMQGIEMAIDEINKAGGVLGRPLKMVTFDIEDMTTEKIVAAAEELIIRQKVDVLLSGYAGMGPDYEVFGQYDVPFFNMDCVTSVTDLVREKPNQYFNCFHLGPTDAGFAVSTLPGVLDFPYGFPNKKIAFIAADFEWEVSYTQLGMAPLAEELGWEVVMKEVVPYGTTDWRAIMSRIRAMNPPPAVIHLESMYPGDSITFLDEFLKNPTDSLIYLGYVVAFPEWQDLVGTKGEGLIGLGAVTPHPHFNPRGAEWAQKFEARYGDTYTFCCAANLYDALYHWKEAAEAVGDPTKYREICTYLQNNVYAGVCGIYDYDDGNSVPASENFPIPVIQIQNGEPVEIFTFNVAVPGTEYKMPPYLAKIRGL